MLKKIFSNTLAQLVAKFVGASLTFLTTLIIIRISGTTVFGDLTKAFVLIAIGFTVIDFGLNAVVVRQFGEGNNLARGFTNLLIARLVLSAVVVVALNLLVQVLPGGYTPEIKSVFWLGSLAIIFQGVFTSCNAVFQSQENYWRPTLSTILGAALAPPLPIILFSLPPPSPLPPRQHSRLSPHGHLFPSPPSSPSTIYHRPSTIYHRPSTIYSPPPRLRPPPCLDIARERRSQQV